MRLLSDTCANTAALSTRSPSRETESQSLTQDRPRPCVSRLSAWKCIESAVRRDARYYQITSLLLLFLYGTFWLRFDISLAQAIISLTSVLLVQFLCTRLWKLPAFDSRSALISGLSLCLLLRTNFLHLAGLAAAVTIASKFLLRCNGKHIFNPTNFGLVSMLIVASDKVWVSPGQWGNMAFFGFLMACIGGLVVNRAARTDVTVSFLAFYLALVFGRSVWLGEPISIPLHRLQNGALLLFAFFMISDPKTTPDSRTGRIVFALLVALGAAFVQFKLFRTNGLLWSLAFFSLATPILDRLLPGERYQWKKTPRPNTQTHILAKKGTANEPTPA